ncbi:MAG TPA: hypothetical protein VJ741_14335 [Solirubrobacteraceae bacterium]|nr:hypothetical protein [Solirubrobacteraceae bacterium]
MFGPSLKSVPGCLVSIVPMLIGVPVAATPGFGPHDDTSPEPPPLLELEPPELDVEVDPPLLAAALPPALELLLLLPHAATNTAAMTATSTKLRRARSAR